MWYACSAFALGMCVKEWGREMRLIDGLSTHGRRGVVIFVFLVFFPSALFSWFPVLLCGVDGWGNGDQHTISYIPLISAHAHYAHRNQSMQYDIIHLFHIAMHCSAAQCSSPAQLLTNSYGPAVCACIVCLSLSSLPIHMADGVVCTSYKTGKRGLVTACACGWGGQEENVYDELLL
jgi:hypothetical protein